MDLPEVKAIIKAEGIAGIPWVCVYRLNGTKVAGFAASFKKLPAVRRNLHTLAELKADGSLDEASGPLPTDPNGFLIVDTGSDDQTLSGSG